MKNGFMLECGKMYRNTKLLELAKDAEYCYGCGNPNDGTIVAAHSNQLRDGKGKGIKAHDYRIAFLCHKCHYELDQGHNMGKYDKIEFWEHAHRMTIGWLFENGHLEVK